MYDSYLEILRFFVAPLLNFYYLFQSLSTLTVILIIYLTLPLLNKILYSCMDKVHWISDVTRFLRYLCLDSSKHILSGKHFVALISWSVEHGRVWHQKISCSGIQFFMYSYKKLLIMRGLSLKKLTYLVSLFVNSLAPSPPPKKSLRHFCHYLPCNIQNWQQEKLFLSFTLKKRICVWWWQWRNSFTEHFPRTYQNDGIILFYLQILL